MRLTVDICCCAHAALVHRGSLAFVSIAVASIIQSLQLVHLSPSLKSPPFPAGDTACRLRTQHCGRSILETPHSK